MKGAATTLAALPAYQTNSAASDAMRRLPAICLKKPIQSVRSMLVDCAAVVQSSRWRWLTKSRYRVRTIASSISQAWWARKTTSRADCASGIKNIRRQAPRNGCAA